MLINSISSELGCVVLDLSVRNWFDSFQSGNGEMIRVNVALFPFSPLAGMN